MIKVKQNHIGGKIISYNDIELLAKYHKCVYISSWNVYKPASYIIHMQAHQMFEMLRHGQLHYYL